MDIDSNILEGLELDGPPPIEPEKKKKKKPVKMLVILAICLIVAGGGGITAWKLLTPAQAAEEPTYKTYTVSQSDIRVAYQADGVVSMPFSYIDAEYNAEITALHVAKGDSFKKGDLLAELDDSSLVTAVDNARDSVQSAEDSLRDANNSLRDAQTAVGDAQTSVSDAQVSVNEAKGNVAGAERTLEKQRMAYDSAVSSAEETAIKKQSNIITQKQTITDLELQIATLKRDIALMEEFPDDYSANEVASKRNSLTTQETKLQTEKTNLAILERETVDNSVTNAKMSLTDAEESLEKTKSNVTKAEASVKKAEDSVAKANANVEKARENVEKAERNLTKAQKNLDDALAKLNNAKLYAPNDGVVMAVNKSVGEMAAAVAKGAGSNTASLIVYAPANAQYTAKASIPELDIGEVFVGQMAEIEIDAIDGFFTGEVTDISNFASSGSNNVVSYQATAGFATNDGEVRDQMNCSITYVTKEVKDVLNVPNDVIYTKSGKSYVKVRNADGTEEERQVTTGFSDGSVCEIKSGLSRGETVVSQTATNSTKSNSNSQNSSTSTRGGNTVIMPGGGAMSFSIG